MLSQSDVTRLLENPSAEIRAETAQKIAADFGGGELSDSERHIAEDIFRVMVRDAEERVREALSVNLKDSDLVPHDVAMTLAQDVDSVALPMLEFTKVLSDEDLVEIIRTQNPEKQTAIAKRDAVSEEVSGALVETGNETVVATLVANDGAEIAESSMQEVLDTFADNDTIKDSMVQRSKLPVTVAERLVVMVSDKMRDHLVANHELAPDIASDLILQSRERATIGLLSPDTEHVDVESLIQQLDENGRLTPSIILRAVCMGDITFFEASLARRAGIPLANARKLVHDPGELGMKSLFTAANMPGALYPATRVALDVMQEMEFDGQDNDRERYSRRMLERILTQYEEINADDLEYLLGKLSKLAQPAQAA